MAETMQAENRTTTTYGDYGGRIRSYGAVGVLLLLVLAAAAVLAYFQVRGPNLLLLDVAVWILALVVFMLAVCMLYVLFTLRGALRQVRTQATEVAVVRALSHRHEILEPRPAPPIEYHPAPIMEPSPATEASASRDVLVIEGIGPVFARRLARAGIHTLRDLRDRTADELADVAQAPKASADRWKAMADLMVLREVDAQAAELLVACNVYSVEGLAAQDVDTLHRRCVAANNRGDNRIMPAEIGRDLVQDWVEAARRYGADGSTSVVSRGTNAPSAGSAASG